MMRIAESARKHGISDVDIEYVFRNAITELETADVPAVIMLLGFDTIGRSLEVAYFVNDDGEEIIIHAMKTRNYYKQLLMEFKEGSFNE